MSGIPDTLKGNPLLKDWVLTGDLPDFAAIKPEHFEPALRYAMEQERIEIKAITSQRAKPTFENTLLAMERTGDLLDRVESVFNMLTGVMSDNALQALEVKLYPLMSKHSAWLFQNKALFKRVDTVFKQRDKLPLLQRRLVEEIHKNFIDTGAGLGTEEKKKLAKIMAQRAKLEAKFDTNRINQVKKPALWLKTEAELKGLPPFIREAAAAKAAELGKPGKYAFLPTGPVTDNFLTYSARRDLREKLFKAWAARNDNDDRYDNKKIASELLHLASETAALLGQPSPAALYLKDNMVKTPARAEQLLRESWGPAVKAYNKEREMLGTAMQQDGINEPLAPWDWRYYAQRIREQRYNLSDDELKPYLSLDNVLEAAFASATKLWSIRFEEVKGAKLYHPDARLWNVVDASGKPIGKFIGDYFGRESKKQGAWMNELRTQQMMDGGVLPIVYNICNFSKANPTLLSLDEARTIFHELGHGLHGLLSEVEYPTLAGCNGPMDYVELPSQLFEKFLLTPPIMQHLRHVKTGEPMPKALADKIHAADNLTAGYERVEFLTSAIVDLELHKLKDPGTADLRAFEQKILKQWQAPEGHYMRHRLPHFGHIFGGYASAYHSYEYAAMLDCDAFAAFEETSDPFHGETAQRLRREIYASGASRDPLESYIAFRGREPRMEALFKSRGFATT